MPTEVNWILLTNFIAAIQVVPSAATQANMSHHRGREKSIEGKMATGLITFQDPSGGTLSTSGSGSAEASTGGNPQDGGDVSSRNADPREVNKLMEITFTDADVVPTAQTKAGANCRGSKHVSANDVVPVLKHGDVSDAMFYTFSAMTNL